MILFNTMVRCLQQQLCTSNHSRAACLRQTTYLLLSRAGNSYTVCRYGHLRGDVWLVSAGYL